MGKVGPDSASRQYPRFVTFDLEDCILSGVDPEADDCIDLGCSHVTAPETTAVSVGAMIDAHYGHVRSCQVSIQNNTQKPQALSMTLR